MAKMQPPPGPRPLPAPPLGPWSSPVGNTGTQQGGTGVWGWCKLYFEGGRRGRGGAAPLPGMKPGVGAWRGGPGPGRRRSAWAAASRRAGKEGCGGGRREEGRGGREGGREGSAGREASTGKAGGTRKLAGLAAGAERSTGAFSPAPRPVPPRHDRRPAPARLQPEGGARTPGAGGVGEQAPPQHRRPALGPRAQQAAPKQGARGGWRFQGVGARGRCGGSGSCGG